MFVMIDEYLQDVMQNGKQEEEQQHMDMNEYHLLVHRLLVVDEQPCCCDAKSVPRFFLSLLL
jgi:hypothetical protein